MSYWAVLLFLCRLLKVIPAHKFVLAISSPMFFAMFYGQMIQTKDSIELPDTTSQTSPPSISTIQHWELLRHGRRAGEEEMIEIRMGNNVNTSYRHISCKNGENGVVKPEWYRWHPEGHQEVSYLHFVTYSAMCVAKKENQNRGSQIILPPCPKKCLNFSQLLLYLLVGQAKPLWSLAPV